MALPQVTNVGQLPGLRVSQPHWAFRVGSFFFSVFENIQMLVLWILTDTEFCWSDADNPSLIKLYQPSQTWWWQVLMVLVHVQELGVSGSITYINSRLVRFNYLDFRLPWYLNLFRSGSVLLSPHILILCYQHGSLCNSRTAKDHVFWGTLEWSPYTPVLINGQRSTPAGHGVRHIYFTSFPVVWRKWISGACLTK